jgi:hypothetical protein
MTRKTVRARVGSDGVLHLPLGEAEANQEVRVTIESAAPLILHQEHLDFLKRTAGAWQGEFERPHQGSLETRDPME